MVGAHGSAVASDGYGREAAQWQATGTGARQRGGGQPVQAQGSAVADDRYRREAARWPATGTGARQRGGG